MLHFDPTIDWSRKLLEPPIPDLLVVQSETPPNTDSPWQSSSRGVLWHSAWAEYAAVDRNEHHLAFTFFDTKYASKEEKLWIAEYTEKSTEAEKAVGWYRCKPSTEKYVEALSKTNTIRCHRRSSITDKQASETPKSVTIFQKMSYPVVKRSPGTDWTCLMIEMSEDVSATPFFASSRWETEFEQPAETTQEGRPSGEPSQQAEVLTLYMVTTSKKTDPVEAISDKLVDE